jgi:thioredoxin 1
MKRFGIIVSLILLSFGQLKPQSVDSVKYKSLEPYDFHLQYLRTDPALLIDVREFFEFRGRRIRDAVNIPSSGNLDFSADTINKDYALFFYCTTDFRSKRVADFFYDKGFRKLYNLEGGIVAWKKDGFPLEKGKVKKKKK